MPELRAYFYGKSENSVLKEPDNVTRLQLDAVCELVTGLLEHATIQRDNLPPTSWKLCWSPYIKHMYESSAQLCEFFRKNRHIYTKAFRDEVERYLKKDA